MKKIIALSFIVSCISATSFGAQICGPLSVSAKAPDCKKGQICSQHKEIVFQVQSAGGPTYDLVMKTMAKLQQVQALANEEPSPTVLVTGKETTLEDDQDQDFQVTKIVAGRCPRQ